MTAKASKRGTRQREEEPEHLDRWLVSYADFITLMFAFFVVLYAISQVNEGKYRVLSDALLNAFRDGHAPVGDARSDALVAIPALDHGEFARRRAEARLKVIAEDLNNALLPLVQQGQVRISDTPRGIAVDIGANLLFAPGRAELAGEARQALSSVAQVLSALPNAVEVEGHTDDSPIANSLYPSNWELSSARASRIVRLFTELGMSPARLSAVGYAEFRSVDDNTTAAGRARNRRVTVLVLRRGEATKNALR